MEVKQSKNQKEKKMEIPEKIHGFRPPNSCECTAVITYLLRLRDNRKKEGLGREYHV